MNDYYQGMTVKILILRMISYAIPLLLNFNGVIFHSSYRHHFHVEGDKFNNRNLSRMIFAQLKVNCLIFDIKVFGFLQNYLWTRSNRYNIHSHGDMAELVDALCSGRSAFWAWEFESLYPHHIWRNKVNALFFFAWNLVRHFYWLGFLFFVLD